MLGTICCSIHDSRRFTTTSCWIICNKQTIYKRNSKPQKRCGCRQETAVRSSSRKARMYRSWQNKVLNLVQVGGEKSLSHEHGNRATCEKLYHKFTNRAPQTWSLCKFVATDREKQAENEAFKDGTRKFRSRISCRSALQGMSL